MKSREPCRHREAEGGYRSSARWGSCTNPRTSVFSLHPFQRLSEVYLFCDGSISARKVTACPRGRQNSGAALPPANTVRCEREVVEPSHGPFLDTLEAFKQANGIATLYFIMTAG